MTERAYKPQKGAERAEGRRKEKSERSFRDFADLTYIKYIRSICIYSAVFAFVPAVSVPSALKVN